MNSLSCIGSSFKRLPKTEFYAVAVRVPQVAMIPNGFAAIANYRFRFARFFARSPMTNLPGQGFRDRKFADSWLEGAGFEPSAPLVLPVPELA